jgi:hypothetical protein
LEELEQFDKRISAKLNRYKLKNNCDFIDFDDINYFPKQYTEVGRVIDEVYDEKEEGTYVFVKWIGLPYDESTWERIEDVAEYQQKIDEFRQRNVVDPCKVQTTKRPLISPADWKKIPEDKFYKNENTLRDYQLEGVNWLLWNYAVNHQNCILADEMGLGMLMAKTKLTTKQSCFQEKQFKALPSCSLCTRWIFMARF